MEYETESEPEMEHEAFNVPIINKISIFESICEDTENFHCFKDVIKEWDMDFTKEIIDLIKRGGEKPTKFFMALMGLLKVDYDYDDPTTGMTIVELLLSENRRRVMCHELISVLDHIEACDMVIRNANEISLIKFIICRGVDDITGFLEYCKGRIGTLALRNLFDKEDLCNTVEAHLWKESSLDPEHGNLLVRRFYQELQRELKVEKIMERISRVGEYQPLSEYLKRLEVGEENPEGELTNRAMIARDLNMIEAMVLKENFKIYPMMKRLMCPWECADGLVFDLGYLKWFNEALEILVVSGRMLTMVGTEHPDYRNFVYYVKENMEINQEVTRALEDIDDLMHYMEFNMNNLRSHLRKKRNAWGLELTENYVLLLLCKEGNYRGCTQSIDALMMFLYNDRNFEGFFGSPPPENISYCKLCLTERGLINDDSTKDTFKNEPRQRKEEVFGEFVRYGNKADALTGLIMGGFDINKRHRNGATFLHLACVYDRPEIVSLLLSNVLCERNIKDNNLSTPIYYACFLTNKECLSRLLMDTKTDFTVGQTPEDLDIYTISRINMEGESMDMLLASGRRLFRWEEEESFEGFRVQSRHKLGWTKFAEREETVLRDPRMRMGDFTECDYDVVDELEFAFFCLVERGVLPHNK